MPNPYDEQDDVVAPPPIVPTIEVVNVDSLISGLDDESKIEEDSIFDNLSLSEDDVNGNYGISRHRGIWPPPPIRPTAEPTTGSAEGGAYLPRDYSMHRNNAMATAVAVTSSHDNDEDVSVAATEVTCSTSDGSVVMIPRAALMKNPPPTTTGPSASRTTNSKMPSSSVYASNVIDLENQTPRAQRESSALQNIPSSNGNRYVTYTSNGGVFLSKRCVKFFVICIILFVTVFISGIIALALMESSDKGPFENNNNSNAAITSPDSSVSGDGYNGLDDNNSNNRDGVSGNASTNLDLFDGDTAVPEDSTNIPTSPCPNGGRALGHGWGGGGGGGGGGGRYSNGNGCNGG